MSNTSAAIVRLTQSMPLASKNEAVKMISHGYDVDTIAAKCRITDMEVIALRQLFVEESEQGDMMRTALITSKKQDLLDVAYDTAKKLMQGDSSDRVKLDTVNAVLKHEQEMTKAAAPGNNGTTVNVVQMTPPNNDGERDVAARKTTIDSY
jgi:hypothetical protein